MSRLTFPEAVRSAMIGSKITNVFLDVSDRGTIHELHVELDRGTMISLMPLQGKLIAEFSYREP